MNSVSWDEMCCIQETLCFTFSFFKERNGTRRVQYWRILDRAPGQYCQINAEMVQPWGHVSSTILPMNYNFCPVMPVESGEIKFFLVCAIVFGVSVEASCDFSALWTASAGECMCACVRACMCTCVCVCCATWVSMGVCTDSFLCLCMHARAHACVHVCMHACVYLRLRVCIYVCVCVSTSVCVYLRLRVCGRLQYRQVPQTIFS